MSTLTTIRIPLDFASFGLPSPLQTGAICLVPGEPGWAWEGEAPVLGIPLVDQEAGETAAGWDLDHVVVLVPDLDETITALSGALGGPRLRAEVQGRPTAFYRVGPVLEVIESPVRAASLFGIALVTEHPLEETALAWRELGHWVTDPQPAIQPGRTIFTVKGTQAGFAVMSPDQAPG
ncbi:MAG: hypothetical protein QNJ81_03225 [Acidimicrobiia bacterium]|nr:hypothetical protein [Acidimicrobiia bacterium]